MRFIWFNVRRGIVGDRRGLVNMGKDGWCGYGYIYVIILKFFAWNMLL